jgi:hypothetical protein
MFLYLGWEHEGMQFQESLRNTVEEVGFISLTFFA